MRVLHVYRTYFPETQGGAEEVIRQICLNTQRHGVRSRVLCISPNVQPRVVRRAEAVVYRSHLDVEIASCSMSLQALPMLRRLLEWADMVHYHFPWPFADLLHFAGRVRLPSVLTYHSDIVRQRVLAFLYTPLMKRFLRSMDRIVCTSPNYLASSNVLRHYKDNVEVVPIGLTPASYPLPTSAQLAQTRRRYGEGFFVFVGVLRYYKGLHILLDALVDAPYRAVIVGAGPTEKELKAQAQRLGLRNVVFSGRVSDEEKVALLTLSRAFVFPSYMRSEAFGVTLLEGAMHAKALISTEAGSGTSHVNVNGETGLVVEPASPAALRQAMDTLDRQPELAERLGANAKHRFERLFNGQLMGDRYAAIYAGLADGREVRTGPALAQPAE